MNKPMPYIPNSSVWMNICLIWNHLGEHRHKQFLIILLLMLLTIVAEIVSIGAIIPFITALTNPSVLVESKYLSPILEFFNIVETNQLMLVLTIVFVVAAVFASVLRILLLWVNKRITLEMGVQLRSEVFNMVLHKPYEYHLENNSSDLISTATEKVGVVIHAGLAHVLLLTTGSIMSVTIMLTLLWVNVTVALSTFLVLGGGYILSAYLFKKRITSNSHIISDLQPKAVKYMQEGVGGIRDVIMDGSQQVVNDQYTEVVYRLQLANTENGFLSGLPKPIVEVIGIVMVSILAYILQVTHADENMSSIPTLGALVFGAQRLLPSLQQVYVSWSTIYGASGVIADVVKQLPNSSADKKSNHQKRTKMEIKDSVRLDNIYFRYNGQKVNVLSEVNLNITKGSRIGFIGETGSGKSTLLDILMGLLAPSTGKILVDETPLDYSNINRWQANVAHVAQSIFLSDASLSENIAYGASESVIDINRVKSAAKQAQISEMIEALPKGYETLVGERGVRLSGGQRQRIGIARALYKEASVIILDEATSALDSQTEEKVMSTINSLKKELTILIIAHRVSTLDNCDCVYQLCNGRLLKVR